MIVTFSLRLSSITVLMTSRRPFGSSIAVGSSIIMHFGFIATTPAIATRCFCPPESLLGEYSRYAVIPTASSASPTRCQISSVGTPRCSGPKPTSSCTTVPIIWLSGFWKIIPAFCLMSQSLSSSCVDISSTYTAPSVGSKSALICFARVDLPEPLWPRIAIN